MMIKFFIPQNRAGHHKNYGQVVKTLLNGHAVEIISSKKKKFFSALRDRNVLLLDIDGYDFYYAILRIILGRKSVAISVSVDETVASQGIKSRIRKFIYRHFKRRLKLFSILKETPLEQVVSHYVSHHIYDLQYYDLPLLNIEPIEVNIRDYTDKPNILIVSNTSSSKKNIDDLIRFSKVSLNYKFIIVSKTIKVEHSNVLVIDRYVSDGELLFLMKNCDLIYCYYSNNRPSGFMGRAMQLGKPVIVRKGSFLDSFSSYTNKFPVEKIEELDYHAESLRDDKPILMDDSDDFIKRIKDEFGI